MAGDYEIAFETRPVPTSRALPEYGQRAETYLQVIPAATASYNPAVLDTDLLLHKREQAAGRNEDFTLKYSIVLLGGLMLALARSLRDSDSLWPLLGWSA